MSNDKSTTIGFANQFSTVLEARDLSWNCLKKDVCSPMMAFSVIWRYRWVALNDFTTIVARWLADNSSNLVRMLKVSVTAKLATKSAATVRRVSEEPNQCTTRASPVLVYEKSSHKIIVRISKMRTKMRLEHTTLHHRQFAHFNHNFWSLSSLLDIPPHQ